ncbi:MAG TPA: competence protein, partial [Lachnospiraceae bacterium]|nr:competence protein [Lachnospiraceae bacterium]
MKIEKINDNQIRCTLTPEDLKARDIRISELTYGSGKARTLFRDMMKEALNLCGFRLDNAPLMIEATPDSGGNLTLIITKVKNPEEIDSRFAHFTGDPSGDDYSFSSLAKDMPAADDILKRLKELFDGDETLDEEKDGKQSAQPMISGTAIVR